MAAAKYSTASDWVDDKKAAVLFAPFREKSLNPHSWEKKMKFWTDALLEMAQIKDVIVLDVNTFTNHFERCGKYPKCIETAVYEMARTGKLKTLSDFQRQTNNWMSWGVDTFVRLPATWALSKLVSKSSSGGDIFVCPEQVQKKCREVLTLHYNGMRHEVTDNLLELTAFRELCFRVVKSEAECDVVLKQLEVDRKVLITKDTEGTVIVKVCSQSEDKVQPPQQIELNVLRIQRVMKCLEQQIEAISEQLDSYTAEARKLVKEGKKTVALHQLRKRRTLQRQLEKKSSCVDTLHEIIHRIETSSSSEMVAKAYESGISAIRHITGDMTIDKVDKVLDDLQEVLEEQEEINQSIVGVGLPGLDTSTAELEEELDTLLNQDKRKGDVSVAKTSPDDTSSIVNDISSLTLQALDDLPDVPTFSPGSRGKTSPQKTMQTST